MFNVVVSLVLSFISGKSLLKQSVTWKITDTFNHTGTNCFILAARGMAHKTFFFFFFNGSRGGQALLWRKPGILEKLFCLFVFLVVRRKRR